MLNYEHIIKSIEDNTFDCISHKVQNYSKYKPVHIELLSNGKKLLPEEQEKIDCYLIFGPLIESNYEVTIFRKKFDTITDITEVDLYTKTLKNNNDNILFIAKELYKEAWGSEMDSTKHYIMRNPQYPGSIPI